MENTKWHSTKCKHSKWTIKEKNEITDNANSWHSRLGIVVSHYCQISWSSSKRQSCTNTPNHGNGPHSIATFEKIPFVSHPYSLWRCERLQCSWSEVFGILLCRVINYHWVINMAPHVWSDFLKWDLGLCLHATTQRNVTQDNTQKRNRQAHWRSLCGPALPPVSRLETHQLSWW